MAILDSSVKPIFKPNGIRPMQVAFFASGGPGNLQAALAEEDADPALLHVGLLVSDRPGIPAINLARSRNILCIVSDFREMCEKNRLEKAILGDSYRRKASTIFHDEIYSKMLDIEVQRETKFDLVVLAYRRVIYGQLLDAFRDRMINQHPADLTSRSLEFPYTRKYTGISGMSRALDAGEKCTRTSTILVNGEIDMGEILCQGPAVAVRCGPLDVRAHEDMQKRISDWPSLRFALRSIARGYFAILGEPRHDDGRRVIAYRERKLRYGGISLTNSNNVGGV